MNRVKVLWQLTRYFGPVWVAFRVMYALRMRSGLLARQTPPYEWSERPLAAWLRADTPTEPDAYAQWRSAHKSRFFFDTPLPEYPFPASEELIAEAGAILAGEWSFFTGKARALGMPPDWHLNPITGQKAPIDRHWTRIGDFDFGDIKYIWEANRFSVVYPLVRAYAATRRTDYAKTFWQLVDNWAEHNPPQRGPNWKCGQEATFRVMAWCFGLYAFQAYATSAQIARLVTMVAAHGERISQNIGYARSQNNNHGVSEGVGLWTIGVLFPEFKQANRWQRLGRRVLEGEIRRQVYEDGSYAQYSPNYQRVMLHAAIWAARLGELNDCPLSTVVYDRIERSTQFLYQIFDAESGQVPNHGSNDSALILPLNDHDPRDFRPILQTAHYLIHRTRLFNEVDEDLFWLFGPTALESPRDTAGYTHAPLSAATGGYYTLRDGDSWLMARCATYRARPHHADQLHVDLWWRGINIACDAGTYLYNGSPPWRNGLATTAVHNTVMVDAQDQMTPYSHFLWLDWSQGTVEQHTDIYWQGRHNGYRRLAQPITHRRAIMRHETWWLVVDVLFGIGEHTYQLHWLTPDMPYQLSERGAQLETSSGPFYIYCSQALTLTRAAQSSVTGWRSTRYAEKEPALSLRAKVQSAVPVTFWTLFSPQLIHSIQQTDNQLNINDIQVRLNDNKLIEIVSQ